MKLLELAITSKDKLCILALTSLEPSNFKHPGKTIPNTQGGPIKYLAEEDFISVGPIYIGSIEKCDAGVNGVVDELDHIGIGFGRPVAAAEPYLSPWTALAEAIDSSSAMSSDSSNVLIEIFNLSGARDGTHVVSLVMYPRQRQLRRALSVRKDLTRVINGNRETNRYFNGHACINPVLVVQVYAINIKSL
uniref:Uncharacterized protein n=1 Tax=Solanum lycopersicum TaxID=4081 RepID=A0A3Q7IAF0_SOLLC